MEKTKGRILCVDNNQDICEMFALLFSDAGYEVSHALKAYGRGQQSYQEDSKNKYLSILALPENLLAAYARLGWIQDIGLRVQ